jgi:hypothetical protein
MFPVAFVFSFSVSSDIFKHNEKKNRFSESDCIQVISSWDYTPLNLWKINQRRDFSSRYMYDRGLLQLWMQFTTPSSRLSTSNLNLSSSSVIHTTSWNKRIQTRNSVPSAVCIMMRACRRFDFLIERNLPLRLLGIKQRCQSKWSAHLLKRSTCLICDSDQFGTC